MSESPMKFHEYADSTAHRKEVMTIIRRSLVGLILLLIFIGTTAFFNDTPSVDRMPLVAVNPAPSHIVWTHHAVGGMMLVNSAARDSAGNTPAIRIPPGSVLSIPTLVEGEDPDSTRTKT